jgi:hypothetical protein
LVLVPPMAGLRRLSPPGRACCCRWHRQHNVRTGLWGSHARERRPPRSWPAASACLGRATPPTGAGGNIGDHQHHATSATSLRIAAKFICVSTPGGRQSTTQLRTAEWRAAQAAGPRAGVPPPPLSAAPHARHRAPPPCPTDGTARSRCWPAWSCWPAWRGTARACRRRASCLTPARHPATSRSQRRAWGQVGARQAAATPAHAVAHQPAPAEAGRRGRPGWWRVRAWGCMRAPRCRRPAAGAHACAAPAPATAAMDGFMGAVSRAYDLSDLLDFPSDITVSGTTPGAPATTPQKRRTACLGLARCRAASTGAASAAPPPSMALQARQATPWLPTAPGRLAQPCPRGSAPARDRLCRCRAAPPAGAHHLPAGGFRAGDEAARYLAAACNRSTSCDLRLP